MPFVSHHIKKQFSLYDPDLRMDANVHFCQYFVTIRVGDSQKHSLTPVLLLAKLYNLPINGNCAIGRFVQFGDKSLYGFSRNRMSDKSMSISIVARRTAFVIPLITTPPLIVTNPFIPDDLIAAKITSWAIFARAAARL